LGFVDDVRVLADAAAVEVALDPIRASILDALTEPGSAATVAAAVGSTRQKVNYHLKALEAHGLVELAEERAWGGITERLMRRSALHLVVAPDVLQSAGIDPNEVADRLSAAYLIAVNARTVSEFAGSFAADLSPGDAAFMADSQVPWRLDALNGAVSEPARRAKPSWYLVATEDRMIPPSAQRAMSERIGASVAEVAASHAVYVSQPDAVADLISKAVDSVTASSR
jgi:pimeloyl-ACP methyl ester carboxylesterase